MSMIAVIICHSIHHKTFLTEDTIPLMAKRPLSLLIKKNDLLTKVKILDEYFIVIVCLLNKKLNNIKNTEIAKN